MKHVSAYYIIFRMILEYKPYEKEVKHIIVRWMLHATNAASVSWRPRSPKLRVPLSHILLYVFTTCFKYVKLIRNWRSCSTSVYGKKTCSKITDTYLTKSICFDKISAKFWLLFVSSNLKILAWCLSYLIYQMFSATCLCHFPAY